MEQQRDKDLTNVKSRGQALVEYVLILALVGLALAAIMVTTSAAVGNVFSNTVYNLIGSDPDDVVRLTEFGGPDAFWQTVTWVAENPMQETPYATRPRGEPPPEVTLDPDATEPPEATEVVPSPTATFTVSPTAVDLGYDLPFKEDVEANETLRRWRLDDSVYLGGGAWKGEYFPNGSLSGTPDYNIWNYQIDRNYTFNVNFDWGTSGYPIQIGFSRWPSSRSSPFSIRYTREISLDAAANLRFTAYAAGGVKVIVDGSTIIDTIGSSMANEAGSASRSLAAGVHTVVVEYSENDGGNAGIALDIRADGGSTGQINPDDAVNTGNAASRCNWGRWNTRNANSLSWMFDENTQSADGAGPNVTCNLELRGYIRMGAATNPVLTFWDVWDFTGSSARAKLQIAEYTPEDGTTNVLDRDDLVWTTVDLHTTADANYNWTRQEINLAALDGGRFLGKNITLRFIIENPGGATGFRRWYIDDIVIQDTPTATDTFKIGAFWDFNSNEDLDDFVYDPRWALTADKSYNGLSLDDSPDYSSDPFSQGTPRIHYVEMKHPVDLTGTLDPDLQGDTEEPLLSFWHTYYIQVGTRLEVQWSRSAANDLTTDNSTADVWTTLGIGPLAEATGSTGPLNTGATMAFVELPLNEIPNWDTQPFRLRFAMIMNSTNGLGGSIDDGGWHIDNVYLERAGLPGFEAYPFVDNAEDPNFTEAHWFLTGTWGRAPGQGQGSGSAYADSPSGNYLPTTNRAMELRDYFDLNNDTAIHAPGYTSTPVTPTLTFWHWRDLASASTFYVDVYVAATDTWYYNIWNTASAPTSTQRAWERVQIDLKRAVETALGDTWDNITTNGIDNDDDIRIAFRLQSSTNTANGVFIDNIRVDEYSEASHRLWAPGVQFSGLSGQGITYTDGFEGDWRSRWLAGGSWDSFSSDTHSGLNAVTDSPGGNYVTDSRSHLEMSRIIDLRGVNASDKPILYFWLRMDIHSNDHMRVQVSQRDGSTTQGFDKVLGWSSWDNLWPRNNGGSVINDGRAEKLNRDWIRVQVDLSDYAGEEIRLRFYMNGNDDSTNWDGIDIDDIRFTHQVNQRIFAFPFFDNAQGTGNWVTEGGWGLGTDRWRGTGGTTVSLGTNPWQAIFVHCDRMTYSSGDSTYRFGSSPNYNGWSNGCGGNNSRRALLADWAGAVNPPGDGVDVLRTTYIDPLALIYPDIDNAAYRPVGHPDSKWNNNYVAYMTRIINVSIPANYSFNMLHDDGIRARIDGPIGGTNINTGDTWNLENDWTGHAVRSTERSMFLAPGQYRITLNWFEATGSAQLGFAISLSNYSFTDSPNTPNGDGTFTVQTPVRNSDTALLLDGVLDLTSATAPVMEFYTTWDFQGSGGGTQGKGIVEVSTNGGFDWENGRLDDDIGAVNFDSATINGGRRLLSSGWLLRRHNLTYYAGEYIGLRFRTQVAGGRDFDGWYISDILIDE